MIFLTTLAVGFLALIVMALLRILVVLDNRQEQTHVYHIYVSGGDPEVMGNQIERAIRAAHQSVSAKKREA